MASLHPHRIDSHSNILKQINASWAQAKLGHGAVFYFHDPEGGAISDIISDLKGLELDASIRDLDLALYQNQPYAPLLVDCPLPHSLNLSSRQTRLWERMDRSRRSQLIELEIVPDEISFERLAIETEILNAQGKAILILRNAQDLPAETVQLLVEDSRILSSSLLILVCFQHTGLSELRKTGAENLFHQKFSQGRVVGLSGSQRSERTAPKEVKEKLGIGHLEALVEWLCLDSAIELASALHESYRHDKSLFDRKDFPRLLRVLALAYEGCEKYDSGLYFAQALASQLSPDKELGAYVEAQLLLARLFMGANDRGLATKAALLGWKLSHESGDRSLIAKADFCLFWINPYGSETEEGYAGLRERLIIELESLDWKNHLCFVLTQNIGIMGVYWKLGWEAADSQCQRGRDLAQSMGNRRRLVMANFSLATLNQIRGNFEQAERHFLLTTEFLKGISKPYEVSRTENGIGYFYFVLGRYRQAYIQHEQALKRVDRTQYYEEIISTLVNLSRLYLFCGQYQDGIFLMEGLFQILDRLNLRDIPFHPIRNLLSLFGILCVRAGQKAQAQECFRKVQLLAPPRDAFRSSEYQLYFEAVYHHESDNRQKAISSFSAAIELMTNKGSESSHFLIRVLMDYGLALREWSEEEEAKQVWQRALGLCGESGKHPHERQALSELLSGRIAQNGPELPAVEFDGQLVLRLLEQDKSMNRLQRKLREFSFLQKWQGMLKAEGEQLLDDCLELIREHFVTSFVFFFDAAMCIRDRPELSEYLEGLKQSLGESPLLLYAPALPEGISSLSYLPIVSGGEDQRILVLGTEGNRAPLEDEDHELLVMACRELGLSLLASSRASELACRQAELERSNQELSAALDTLKHAQAQLVQSEKLSALGKLVAGVAHEINTPLGVAISAVSYLKDKNSHLMLALESTGIKKSELESFLQQNGESAEIIIHNLVRAEGLVQSFKLVAADQSSEQRRSFDLKAYAQDVLLSLKPRWKKSGIEVQVEGDDGVIVDSYPGAYAQLISNLFLNSLIHGFTEGQSGQILIDVRAQGDSVLLRVIDNGAGIPENLQNRVFEPFFTTKRGQGGTGLGLHICYNLVSQRLGGQISFTSVAEKGTTFLLRLPRVSPEASPGQSSG